jgi:hypothetical protein
VKGNDASGADGRAIALLSKANIDSTFLAMSPNLIAANPPHNATVVIGVYPVSPLPDLAAYIEWLEQIPGVTTFVLPKKADINAARARCAVFNRKLHSRSAIEISSLCSPFEALQCVWPM